jgi:glycine/D-amino acid oxidase-like deaminating enzyme/nitrite reductase/ring-hydroxylating ferredoxin subunit
MIKDIKTSGNHISFWSNSEQAQEYHPLRKDIHTDVVIVGAGITGLSIGYMLAKRGHGVVILDDGLPGSGETGRTTAHLVTALDDRYRHIEHLHGAEKAQLAAESHREAINLIEEIIKKEQIHCDFERVSGYLFRHASDEPDALEKELEAAIRAGVDVQMVDSLPGLPSENKALEFGRQAQFHIGKYINGLCRALEKHGAKIYTSTHAKKISHEGVETEESFVVKSNHIVVATNTPVNNRFVIHTKQTPYRTYVIAAKIEKGVLPKALWWDTGDQSSANTAKPYHYVRIQELDQTHDLLISGGEDHITGVIDNNVPEENRYMALEKWTRERFPIREVSYHWSGQVMETMDALAFIGRNPMDKDNVYIATGDSGNGMTHATIAAMLIPDLIEGKANPWEKLYDPGRFKLFAAGGNFIRDNMGVLTELFRGYTHHPDLQSFREVKKEEGKIVEVNGEKYGAYRDDSGNLHIVTAICPHMKCVVKWNNDEDSWDCPCHGSRFTIDGKVVNGPANENLQYFHYPLEKF